MAAPEPLCHSPHIHARAVLQRLGDVWRGDLLRLGQVGDRASEFEDAVERAYGETRMPSAFPAYGGFHALAIVCGAGIGRPHARLASIQLSIASCPCFTASS